MTVRLAFKTAYVWRRWRSQRARRPPEPELAASPWCAPADAELLYVQLALGLEHG